MGDIMAKEKKDISNYIIVGMVAAVVGAGGGYLLAGGNSGSTGGNAQMKHIKEAREVIKEKGDPDFNDELANQGMINGYLKAADKYAFYYNYKETDPAADMTDEVNKAPTAVGSGFTIDRSSDGNILLKEVKPGMAADKQGLKTGDEITKIDGISVSEQGYENFAKKILGKPDTEVKLTIHRGGQESELTFKRENKKLDSVISEKYGKTGYIHITTFDDFTVGQLALAFESIGTVDSLVIDLRDNLGGRTDFCTAAASSFVDKGNVTLKNYNGSEKSYSVEPGNIKIDVPTVVLINKYTASAAESMTAILKDGLKKCTIVGTNTYGKGVYQDEESLKSGGVVHYTAGKFYVNDRENWQGIGIAPDIVVEMDRSLIGTDDDVQLKKALDLLD